jgi:signal transduction histidine kinase/ActR/RegA family two-component response regulator
MRDAAGRILKVYGSLQDITAHKREEREREKLQTQLNQAQKMESVGRLAGGVAHDFNNILTVINGYAEMAMMQVDPANQLHGYLKIIQDSALHSTDLVRQLLAFARKQTITPKVLDLNDTVASMLKMLQRLIGEDIEFGWMPGARLWPVRMDPSQIDQLLANLCVNARDAISGVGKVIIETDNAVFDTVFNGAHMDFIPGEYVMLAVSDNGCGMDRETVGKIFEPFFTTKEVGKGTGLGLATVYGIVKQNGGFINVYSEPGKGSTFKIYLPRCLSEAQEVITTGPGEMPKGGKETVLFVEDDAVILTLGKEILERLGYTVLGAETPGEAIRIAKKRGNEIQLLITDVIMPEMNGRDLAELLKAIIPGLKYMFSSGYTADVIAHQNILPEDINFLEKPFSVKSLAAKVRETLERD